MAKSELEQLFENRSNCYADASQVTDDVVIKRGNVIMVMTKEKFIETVEKLIKDQEDWLMVNTNLEVSKVLDFTKHFKK